MAWSEDLQSPPGAVELTEDLVSNGTVIMPAGTQLTVELAGASSSGMVELRITSIILPESSYSYMQIPVEAITIRSNDGSVLVAKEMSGSERDINRLTRNQAILGAIGQVGSVLNRPNSSNSAIGPTGAISSTDFGSPSILGAVLEGAANTVIAQRAQQNQDQIESLQDRSSILAIEHGTNIEIFINQRILL
nr:TrbI/VirB10 family protein [cf. Phormidesmis sp. LEGE 11477]